MQRLDIIDHLISQASEEKIRLDLFFLSKDPLPYRKANYTRPGQTKNSLDETDDFLEEKLARWGYTMERESAQIQAFRCDASKHPSHWYSSPDPTDPWYPSCNLYARKAGLTKPDQIVLLVAHKDSPSWIDCPGAEDNASGASCSLEVARLLADYPASRSIWFLYCNEEHAPWTSVAAAKHSKERSDDLIAILNLDGPATKSLADQAAGRRVGSTVYGTPEGECLADLLAGMNDLYDIGLVQTKHYREEPGNDDGSFIRAGFPAAIGIHGSHPWDDPIYHRPEDLPERVDTENLRLVAKQVVAAVVMLDRR